VIGVIVALLAATFAGQRAHQGVLDNLDARLRDGGAGTDAAIVSVEAEQLSALRSLEFTPGVASALASSDPTELNKLVTPIHANSDVPMVDIVRPDGAVVFAVRSTGAPRPVASRAGLPALAKAIHDAKGVRGGRFSEVVIFKSGPTLITAGPLSVSNTPVGVALVMTPLADVLGRISQIVRAELSAYTIDGTPIATTAVAAPPDVPRNDARSLVGGAAIEMRFIHGHDREALGRLIVDHQPVAVLGVALHDNSPATGWAVTLLTAIGLVATVLILASFWARVTNRQQRERST
jgi:hypothetical protein